MIFRRSFVFLAFVLCTVAWRPVFGQAERVRPPATDTGVSGLYRMLASVGAHPAIAAQLARLDAARSHIATKSSLANPMLMLGIENLPTTFDFSEEPMTSKMVGISQAFPFPGKLAAEAAIAAQDTTTAQAELTEVENRLARDVKLAYFEIYHMERAVATNEYHLNSLDELLAASRGRLATNEGTQLQVLDLELERTDILNQIIQDRSDLAMKTAQIEAVTAVTWVRGAMPAALAMPALNYTLQQLDSIAAIKSPRLAGERSEAEQQALQYNRDALDRYPDFQVSLQYMQRNALSASSQMNPDNSQAARQLGIMPMPMPQTNMISATLSVELPLNYGNARSNALEEARSMQAMKLAEARATMLEIHTELRSALARLEGIRQRYALLRDQVYPLVRQSLETTNSNYRYGKTGLEQVLRGELNLLHREHDRYELEAEYNETLAGIEYLTGANLVAYSSAESWK